MAEVLVPIVVVPVIFFSIVYAIKIASDNAVRRKLIDKGMVDENVKHLFAKQHLDFVPHSLKWGMVLIAVGVAILGAQFVPYSFRDEATASGMFILGGLALIVYYFIANKQTQNQDL